MDALLSNMEGKYGQASKKGKKSKIASEPTPEEFEALQEKLFSKTDSRNAKRKEPASAKENVKRSKA